MKKCSRIIVKGNVQGVFFRDFVKQQAQDLNIEGTVQNAHDGTVIINACGTTDKLEDFIDALYQGSPKASVEEVAEEPMTQTKDFRGVFRIIGSG